MFQWTMNLPICLNFIYLRVTNEISHSSSIIITYSCEQLNKILTTTRSTYQPPKTSVLGLIIFLSDWLQCRRLIRWWETGNIPFLVCPIWFCKTIIYTEWYLYSYLLPMVCDINLNASTEFLKTMFWCCGILVLKWKWEDWK